jgi:hypothetical protein
MTLMDEPVWRGPIYSGGRAANLEAFTGTRRAIVRSDSTPHPC